MLPSQHMNSGTQLTSLLRVDQIPSFTVQLTVLTTLKATKPAITLKERVYRKIKSIDLDTVRMILQFLNCAKKPTRSLMSSLNVTIRHWHMFWQTRSASKKNHSPKATRTLVQRSGFSCKKDEKESRKKMALIKFYTRPKRIQICNKTSLLIWLKKARSDFYENLIEKK